MLTCDAHGTKNPSQPIHSPSQDSLRGEDMYVSRKESLEDLPDWAIPPAQPSCEPPSQALPELKDDICFMIADLRTEMMSFRLQSLD